MIPISKLVLLKTSPKAQTTLTDLNDGTAAVPFLKLLASL